MTQHESDAAGAYTQGGSFAVQDVPIPRMAE